MSSKLSDVSVGRSSSDGSFTWAATGTTTGFYLSQGVCRGGAYSSYPYPSCSLALQYKTADGTIGTLQTSGMLTQPYPFSFNFSGSTEIDKAVVALRVEASGFGSNNPPVDSDWTTVSDLTAAEMAGGSNASENACPCMHADPINTATGEYTDSMTDLALPGVGPAVGLTRTYSSVLASTAGPFGYGWTSGLAANLRVRTDGSVVVRQENGAEVTFFKSSDGSYHPLSRVLATLTNDASGWTFTRRASQVLKFDPTGALLSQIDLHGNPVTYTHDGSGEVTAIAGSGGRTINLTWSQGRILSASDSANRTVTYGYDAAGELSSVTAADGAVTQFSYGAAHHLTSVTWPAGGQTTNTYDSSGRVVSQTDPDGRITQFSYNGFTTTTADPSGTKTAETYNGGLLARKVVDVDGAHPRTSRFSYDDSNNLISSTDPDGKTSRMTYDAQGNVLTKTDPLERTTTFTYDELNDVLSSTDALSRETTATYDSSGDQLTAVDAAGKTKTWTYNTDGTVASLTNELGRTTTYTYMPAGLPVSTTDPDNRVRSVTYNDAGFVKSETDSAGKVTKYTRDAVGRPLTVEDADGNVTTNVYDPDGNLITVTDPRGHATHLTYDLADQKRHSTDANGDTTSWTYTPGGQVETVTDARAHVTTNGYDSFGELTSVTAPGKPATTYTYDAEGRRTSTTLPSGAESRVGYDDAGEVTSTTDPLGKVTRYTYNDAGERTSSKDPLGRITKQEYSTTGLPTVKTLPGGATETTTYNAAGQQTGFTNADGLTTSYVPDPAGLLSSKTEPGAMTTSYTYDAAGRQQTVTTPNGHVTTDSYSDAGRLTRVHSDVSGSTDVTYTWDADGNRDSMTDATGTTRYSYDLGNRLTSVTNGAGNTLEYGYDSTGNVTTLTYPGDSTATYTYDSTNQMTSVTDWANRTSNFTWSDDGQLKTQAYANGVTETRSYDTNGRLTQAQDVDSTGTTLGTYGYGYDDAGQLTSDSSNDPLGASIAHTYSYDTTSQLASINGSGTTGTVAATAGGQLTAAPTSGTLAYNGKQQVTALTPPTGAASTYSYNDNGDRTAATTGASTTGYSYNAFDDLTTATMPGKTISYTSNGDDLRQSRTTGSGTKQLLWNTNGALPLLLDDGDQTYLYGPATTPIAQIDSTGTIQYLHTDQLGTPRLITTDTGSVTGTMAYTAYGTPAGTTGTAASNIGYTGNWTDPDTGLIYLRARDYDPTTGQFLTVDPALEGTHQPYAYTGNDPLAETDPLGLCGSTPTPAVQCSDPGFFNDILLSAPAIAIGNLLTQGPTGAVASGLEGIGEGATGGLAGIVRNALVPSSACYEAHDGFFQAGQVAGTALGAVTTGGGSTGLKAVGAAARAGEEVAAGASEVATASQPLRFYSARVLNRAAEAKDTYHNFPQSFNEEVFSSGQQTRASNYFNQSRAGYSNDSIRYSLSGSINGEPGSYEIFTRPSITGRSELIMHRAFRPTH